MARYRIELTLRDPCPFELTHHEINVGGMDYRIEFDATRRSMSLSEVTGSDHQMAARSARDTANRFLNFLFALSQFPGELEADYKYENLDVENDRGQVVHAGPVVGYSFQGPLPDKLDLSTDRRGAAFVRRGDLARDPFDRFRNYFLAADCIGKSLTSTSDSIVIADTLSIIATPAIIESLNRCLAKVNIPNSVNFTGDPVKDINTVLYKGFRCALMHSGDTADFTPFNVGDEEMVVSALRLMRGVAWQYVKFHETTARVA